MTKTRLPRKQKKQSRLVSKWLAAHPEYRPRRIDPLAHSMAIRTYELKPIKYRTQVRESVEFCERCPDAMERIGYMLAEGFIEAISNHMAVHEVTDQSDTMQMRRRFEAVLSIVDENNLRQFTTIYDNSRQFTLKQL